MKKYSARDIEQKHREKWEERGVYNFHPEGKGETFVIDTPPPTVSGRLHIGHLFSYSQTDIIARFQRMRGKNVFYPMGWDDNGLPTEKRIQNLYGVSCDPSLPYKPENFQPLPKKTSLRRKISRRNFLELCDKQAQEDEQKYRIFWSRLGLSVDWSQTYRTIDAHSRKISQTAFINLYKKGLLENRLQPVFWDTQFQTAVAQADMEDRKKEGFYHDIKFKIQGGGDVIISTTRPELLPACVALTAHPEDSRYKAFFSKTAFSPLFHGAVPVLPSPHADPEKGTGILMVCTFGDGEDVRFQQKHKLPVKQILRKDGRLRENISWPEGALKSLEPAEAEKYYKPLAGQTLSQARKIIVQLLRESGDLTSAPRPVLHFVKYYEKGDRPLELIPARQWFVKILDHKEAFLERGREIKWHPPSIRKRYEQWVEGLNQDWCVSRQRFFGVPVPLWYPLDKKGGADFTRPVLSDLLPVDPVTEAPPGYEEKDRDRPGGWTADPDVLDTWATSSLTPLINSRWEGERHKKLFPADLRPQAHEIIRTWAFYTIAQAHFHENKPPWRQIAVSGWVTDTKRSKMSKSKGNAVTPEDLMDTYSADALRYWAGRAGLGRDTVYDEQTFRTGQKLVTKIFNAARFVGLQTEQVSVSLLLKGDLKNIIEPVDRAWIGRLCRTHAKVTEFLETFNYDSALKLTEETFWTFCDNYIELVKARAYRLKNEPKGVSSALALDGSLYLFLKMFAPFLPYITEEVWSWRYTGESDSLHTSPWKAPMPAAGIDLFPVKDSRPWKASTKSAEESLPESSLKATGENRLKSPLESTGENRTESSLESVRESRPKSSLESMGGSLPKPSLESREDFLDTAFDILEQIRNQKSSRRKSLSHPVQKLILKASPRQLGWFELCREDLLRAGHIQTAQTLPSEKAPLQISLTME